MATKLTDIALVDYLNEYDYFKPEIIITATEVIAEIEQPTVYLQSVFLSQLIQDTNREFYLDNKKFYFKRD